MEQHCDKAHATWMAMFKPRRWKILTLAAARPLTPLHIVHEIKLMCIEEQAFWFSNHLKHYCTLNISCSHSEAIGTFSILIRAINISSFSAVRSSTPSLSRMIVCGDSKLDASTSSLSQIPEPSVLEHHSFIHVMHDANKERQLVNNDYLPFHEHESVHRRMTGTSLTYAFQQQYIRTHQLVEILECAHDTPKISRITSPPHRGVPSVTPNHYLRTLKSTATKISSGSASLSS